MNRKMKKYLFVLVTLFSMSLQAQQITLTGKVISATDNEPLTGATVIIKGTTHGIITGLEGDYILTNIPPDATLIVSNIGFKSREIAINGRTNINVLLQENIELLDEVVVIGYGVVKKSDLTSSISTVKGEELRKMTSGNAMYALQGKANGIQISSGGGPGNVPRVIIRGVSSINGSAPLYVVDGMPVTGNINFLNQEDIESIEILKDASAAAIYGTRGSNGVVLVTTKKGRTGKTQFQVNTSIGLQTLRNPEMAKPEEYEKVFKARYINDGNESIWNSKDGISNEEGTDWWKEVVNNIALTQSYNISFQGGSDKIVYSGSIGYFKQNSQYDKGYWDKLTARFNTEYIFSKKIKFGTDIMPILQTWDNTPGLLGAVMRIDPTTPIFRPEEEWTDNKYSNYARSYNNLVWNPVASLDRANGHTDEYGLLMNSYINLEPVKGLIIRTQFGVNARFQLSDDFVPQFFIDNLEKQEESFVERKINNNIDWNWTNTVHYMTTIAEKHNLTLLGGYTMEKFSYYYLNGSRENTPNNMEELRYVSAGTKNEKTSGSNRYQTLLSYLGRMMYNFDNRYYLTASVRTDGSSKFAKGNKYATFPAVSGAWRISEEAFMENLTFISDLKLRAGWGRVGNQNIGPNSYISLIETADYVFGTSADRELGTAVSLIGNTKLRWETVEDYNIGLNVGLLNGRLNLAADIFRKKSKDMLMKKGHLLILGYPMANGEMWTNIGSMEANGWEFSTHWNDKGKDYSYEIGLNLSSIKNKATKLNGEAAILTGGFHSDYIIRNEEGGEISRFYGYVADGIFQNETEINAHVNKDGELLQPDAVPGDIRFVDLNGDGVIDTDDKKFIGSAFPDLMIGLNAYVTYKHFDFTANFYGTIGNDIFNKTLAHYSGAGGDNVYAGTYDKVWHGEGTSNYLPRLSVVDPNLNYKRVSSFFVENGSYFRCKLMQIGYTFPKSMTKTIGIRLSASAQNLFTITKYSGMDPERASMGGVTESGIDNTGYPNPRTYLFGINFTF